MSHTQEAPPRNLNHTPNDPQWVRIESRALHWDLLLLLGDGFVTPNGGGATFDEITVPNDKTILNWSGESLYRLTVPVMLDSWVDDIEPPTRDKQPPKFKNIKKKRKRHRHRERWRKVRDTERPLNVASYIELLEELKQPLGASDHKPPAVIRVYGKAVPKYLNGDIWQIEEIEYGDPMHNPFNGKQVRQQLTLNLVEPNEGGRFKLKKHKQKHHGGGGGGRQTYMVKRGDTLQSIAAKFYGDASKWHRIADANNIKNPRDLSKYVGDRIKIP